MVVTFGGTPLSSGQASKGRCPRGRMAFSYSETVKDTKRIKKRREKRIVRRVER